MLALKRLPEKQLTIIAGQISVRCVSIFGSVSVDERVVELCFVLSSVGRQRVKVVVRQLVAAAASERRHVNVAHFRLVDPQLEARKVTYDSVYINS